MVDGEYILSFLEDLGFQVITEYDKADIIIVNTCAFIQEAKQEAIQTIFEMAEHKKNGQCKVLIVTGCFSQRYRNEVAEEFPEVNAWIGITKWREELRDYFKNKTKSSSIRKLSEPIESQYLKISQGCSHKCAFCVIPKIRGTFKSRTPSEIITEANWLYEQGTRECILVSQDTSYYGRDIGTNLEKLVERFLKETRFPWIRLMYLHPAYVTDGLLKLMESEPRFCSYIDMPLQHISQKILKAMKRFPPKEKVYKLIERIRTLAPSAAIRTAFILGYPGEGKKEFSELLHFVETTRFERLGVFPFSPEEGTAAYNLRPRPRDNTTQRRCETIMEVQRQISSEHCEEMVGKTQEVFIESHTQEGPYSYEGRTEWDAPEVDGKVYIRTGDYIPGTIVKAKIIDADNYDLFAEDAG